MSEKVNPLAALTPFNLELSATNPLSRAFFQLGLVVPDLESACSRLKRAFGIPGFFMLKNAPFTDSTYLGKPADIPIDIAFGFLGEINIEVIRPQPGGDNSAYSDFLQHSPEGGIHHLGFRTFDFDNDVKAIERELGPQIQNGQFGDKGTRYAYFDSRPVMGLYTEVMFMDPAATKLMEKIRVGNLPNSLG